MKELINNFIFNHYLDLIEDMTALPPCRDFKSLKKELLKNIDLNPFLTYLIFVLSGLLVFKNLIIWQIDFLVPVNIMRTIGTASLIYGSWCLIQEITAGEFKKWLLIHLHEVLVDRQSRSGVILWRYQRVKSEADAEEIKFKICENEIKHNLKCFCEKTFGVSTSSFLNFYHNKVLMGDEIYEDFLNYSLSIPKRRELGSDSLRKILLAFHPLNVIITDKVEKNIETSFTNYSSEQIEKIFTSPHEKDYWEDLVEKFKELDHPIPLRVYDSFYEMRFDEERISGIPSELWALNGRDVDSYQFSLLLTRKDYVQASEDFSNCLRHYSDRWSSVIFRVKYKACDYACIEIYKGKIREIKGLNNKELNAPTLRRIVKNYLPK